MPAVCRHTRYLTVGRVVTRAHLNGAMALNMDTGACFEMNTTAGEIWRRLVDGQTVAQIAAELASTWRIASDVCERDALKLIDELMAAGLLAAAVSHDE